MNVQCPNEKIIKEVTANRKKMSDIITIKTRQMDEAKIK